MGVLGMRSAVVFHGIKDSSRKEEGKRVIAVVVVLQQRGITRHSKERKGKYVPQISKTYFV
jgi:hypothetical protein